MKKLLLFIILLIPISIFPQQNHYVYVSIFFNFYPSETKIKVGDKVTWQVLDGVNHTTTSVDQNSKESWDKKINGNDSYTKKFETAGQYEYYCKKHKHEKGVIIVTDPTPVELTSFKAENSQDKVILKWQTSSEINNLGFDIERKFESNNWEVIGFVEGKGNSTEINDYSFTDENLFEQGKYFYRLKQRDFDGAFEYSPEIEIDNSTEGKYILKQNYPNPFNPETKISYFLPKSGFVNIKVYNALGNEVRTLVNENQEYGNHEVNFDGSNLSSGVYYLQLKADDFQQIIKMILLR